MQCLTLTTHIKNNVCGTKNEILMKVLRQCINHVADNLT